MQLRDQEEQPLTGTQVTVLLSSSAGNQGTAQGPRLPAHSPLQSPRRRGSRRPCPSAAASPPRPLPAISPPPHLLKNSHILKNPLLSVQWGGGGGINVSQLLQVPSVLQNLWIKLRPAPPRGTICAGITSYQSVCPCY